MPTYDYECNACGHRFDAFQSMSDDLLKKCPACGKLKLKRLIGGGLGIIFKGSGFYVTDSKKSSSSSITKTDSASSDTGTSKSSDSPSTGTKTEKKSDSSGATSSSEKSAAAS